MKQSISSPGSDVGTVFESSPIAAAITSSATSVTVSRSLLGLVLTCFH